MKPEIKELKYPLWLNLVFYLLTIMTPIVMVVVEGLRTPNHKPGAVGFKITFTTICIFIIVWFFVKRLFLKNYETKLVAKQLALEHDYAINVGDANKIKYLWYKNEKKFTIFNAITTGLYGGLIIILTLAITSDLMTNMSLITKIITGLYVIAYTLKFVYIMIKSGSDEYEL